MILPKTQNLILTHIFLGVSIGVQIRDEVLVATDENGTRSVQYFLITTITVTVLVQLLLQYLHFLNCAFNPT